MASDELMQRSVRLLDEAIGSPMQYTSPSRPLRHRSSMFGNSVVPIRRSDVRQFALNDSLTLSTSELEAFMENSVATQCLGQRTLIRNATDDLFQTFLESMQAHTTAREVFDIIREFALNCTNMLDVIQETACNEELKWLEQERNTWRLVHCLYNTRLSALAESDDQDMEIIVKSPSEKEIMLNFYKTNSKINEYQLVADWLEKNAADRADAIKPSQLQHYMDNTVAWENTLHQLQNKTVAYTSSRDIVDQLDPDAPLRQGKPLHDLDMEDESRLMKQVWEELRCGRLNRAQDACMHCGQSWRAATLEGWRLYHDPNYTKSQPSATEKHPVEGNLHRDVWKLCAWRLADNVQAGKHTRAVYGLLCGHIVSVLPVCQTWEDMLWAHIRVLVDLLVEKEIRNNSLRELVPLPSDYWDNKLTIEDTFASLDSSGDPVIRKQAASPERVMQKHLILDQLPQMLNAMQDWTTQQECDPQMVRFLAHLVLVLRILGQPVSQQTGDAIVKAYVKVIMRHQDPTLVAYYTATLVPEDQVTLYADFLQQIDESELRKSALTAAESVHLPVEAITQRVVENIREEKGDTRASLQLSEDVTEEDRRKIFGLEWVVMYPSQRAEALWQANALIRTFLGLGKTQAARLAFNQIPVDSIDHVMTQWSTDSESFDMYSDCLPSRVSSAVQEYLSHKAYLDAQEGFADWFSHYQHGKPTQPPNPGASATFTEKVAHDHRMAAYQRELERWQSTMDHQTKCVKQQLYNVLLFPRGGWLADCYKEDRLRAHQMKSLRAICIPKIVLLLHTVLHSMRQYKEAIQLADLVTSEQHQLYKVYLKQQISELLSKIRESSLASMNEGKDPWGLPLTF